MRLTGWNNIPTGYGARFEVRRAPWRLRVLYATPFLDRFAYPLLVRRGLGVLTPHPGWDGAERATITGNWQVRDGADPVAGSVSPLTPRNRP